MPGQTSASRRVLFLTSAFLFSLAYRGSELYVALGYEDINMSKPSSMVAGHIDMLC